MFVHELGHFLSAKWSGIKVSEFALGFPPKIFSFKKGETTYSLNWVPFGGFVRIHGENAEDDPEVEPERSMVNKPWYIQIFVLSAGVLMNFLFAWLLISITLMTGYPTAVNDQSSAMLETRDPHLMILNVEKGSPAEMAGIVKGDRIKSVTLRGVVFEPESVEEVIGIVSSSSASSELTFSLLRNGESLEKNLYATSGIISDRPAVGISMGYVGIAKYGPIKALVKGLEMTVSHTVAIVNGLGDLLTQTFRGEAKLSSVTGPVGIAGMVGDASHFGLSYLLGFTAFISLNLAVINLVPFPALDGGRILVVLIEAISRRKVPANWQLYLNGIGFTILIGLMVVVTVGDVLKLFK